MRKALWVAASLLVMALPVVASLAGCQQQPGPVATPSLAILVESNIVEAGSSFMVSGSNFKPNQKVWVDFEWRASDGSGGVTAYCEADEEGSIHPMIPIPEDIVPGDYEVRIYTGEDAYDRHLFTKLPIHVQAVK